MFLLFIGIDKLSLRLFKGELVSCVNDLLSCLHKLVSWANKLKEGLFSELLSFENKELVSCLNEFKEDLVSVIKVGRVPCAYNEEDDLLSCAYKLVSCTNEEEEHVPCANNSASSSNRFLSCAN